MKRSKAGRSSAQFAGDAPPFTACRPFADWAAQLGSRECRSPRGTDGCSSREGGRKPDYCDEVRGSWPGAACR